MSKSGTFDRTASCEKPVVISKKLKPFLRYFDFRRTLLVFVFWYISTFMSLSTGANVQFRCTIIDIETKIQRLYGFEYLSLSLEQMVPPSFIKKQTEHHNKQKTPSQRLILYTANLELFAIASGISIQRLYNMLEL